MKEQDIIKAYTKIRTIDNTIPDDVLDFMKNAAIEQLRLCGVVFNEADLCDDSCKYYCTKGFTQERECLADKPELRDSRQISQRKIYGK